MRKSNSGIKLRRRLVEKPISYRTPCRAPTREYLSKYPVASMLFQIILVATRLGLSTCEISAPPPCVTPHGAQSPYRGDEQGYKAEALSMYHSRDIIMSSLCY